MSDKRGPIQSADATTPVEVSLNPDLGQHQIDVSTTSVAGSFEIDIATPGRPSDWQTLKNGGSNVTIAAPNFSTLTGLIFFANRVRLRPTGLTGGSTFSVTVTSRE